jgi:CheY-like chemotaxis protein
MKVFQVLLAEDDISSAGIVINLLERYNFFVTHVVDGKMALSRVRIKEFDLIICDIMMPHLDGLSFIEKGKEHFHNTPIVMLTSAGEKDMIVRAAHSGVGAYLLKPMTSESLFEKISPLLHLSPESLIDKKLFPLNMTYSSNSLTNLEMKIEGIPWRKDKGQIFESFSHYLAGRSTFTDLNISIDPNFFLEGRALPILEDFLSTVAKRTKIRSKNIHIHSTFLKRLGTSLKEFECLKDVFII